MFGALRIVRCVLLVVSSGTSVSTGTIVTLRASSIVKVSCLFLARTSVPLDSARSMTVAESSDRTTFNASVIR